jgi:pyruvate decarboxylase
MLTDDKATHHTPSSTNKDQALHLFQGVTAASVRITSTEIAAGMIDETIIKCVRESLCLYILRFHTTLQACHAIGLHH